MKIYKTTFLFSINAREIVTGGKIKSKNTGCCSNYVSNMYISLCVNFRRSIELVRDKSQNIQNNEKRKQRRENREEKIENERKKILRKGH